MSSAKQIVDRLPGLTNSQSLVWMSQKLAPESSLFNMAHRFDLYTNILPDNFHSALQQVTDQSDAMRTVFLNEGNSVQQIIRDSMVVEFEVLDFSSEADPDESAALWMHKRAKRTLDLSICCHDSALIRLGQAHWTWFINIHHLIADAWSITLICRELGRYYKLACDGLPLQANNPPKFLDYRHHEQQWKQNKSFAEASEHWRVKARAPSGLITLYGQKGSRSSTQSTRVTAALGAARSQCLRELEKLPPFRSLSPHLSRFNLLATAVFAYLYRIGNGQHLTLGTPAHNRPSLAFRETIGMFIETLPFSTSVDEGETFRTLFEKITVESKYFLKYAQPGCSNPELARLFNVVFNYINTSFPDLAGTDMQSQLVHSDQVDSGHDLRIQIHDINDSGEYVVHFDCNQGTLRPRLRALMVNHFLMVLDAFIADQDAIIENVVLITDAERKELLYEFNPNTDEPLAPLVLKAFERCAERFSKAPATQTSGKTMSYYELAQRSDKLARHLLRHGVETRTAIGICMYRSPDFITTVLAILKAGAVFVPLEANLPEERLRYIASDSGMSLVISDRSLLGRSSTTETQWLCIDEALADDQSDSSVPTLPRVSPQDAAYIIYTSGSTGYPKGVVVQHHALAAYVHWAHQTFASGGRCDFPLYSAIGFDLTITSLFVPLISGACVVVYPEQHSGPDLSVLQVFEDDAVDVVKLTPAHLALVMEQPHRLQRIRSLILGGENLTTEVASQALAALGPLNIYNEYGPTEAVVGCMRHLYDPAVDTGASVPIGVPAGHHRIYLLDMAGNPVPLGVSGEIHIAGQHLAFGYLNRDNDTNERFLPDTFRSGETMYRTGDLARFNSRGLIEYQGRSDEQIKIGGVRIEPAEVTRAISAFPGVVDSIVDVMAPTRSRQADELHFCTRCGLSSELPDVSFDAHGVCHLCEGFDTYREKADVYFNTIEQLQSLLATAKQERGGAYDCIMLLSGGKDSTYALYRLAELGPKILALTLDNGFVSDGARDNIQRVVESVGVDHRFVGTPHMNEIFSDSLERHSNVCHGCFKTIYTLALQTALEEKIPCIVTGLSRGQFFETRLTPELFGESDTDLIAIERTVLEARRAYHGIDDAVSRCMDVSMFENQQVLDKVAFIDFYRYCDVSLEEVYRFLNEKASWVRPSDTGRSTNCTINDAGIYIHKRKEGYHNYALPYSWDVRMGHKTRDAALDELNDHIDVVRVHQILDEIGYVEEGVMEGAGANRLVAYYTSDNEINTAALRDYLAKSLPAAMIPSFFVALNQFPLTSNGKIDRAALPMPQSGRPEVNTVYLAPRDDMEKSLAGIWRTVMEIERVGILDNYYALGGDSISAIQIAVRAQESGIGLQAIDIFEHQTIESLSLHLTRSTGEHHGNNTTSQNETPTPFSLAGLDESTRSKVQEMLSGRTK